MSTKTKKILTFVATLLLVLSIGAGTVFAGDFTPEAFEDVKPTNNTDVTNFGRKIIGILQAVGIVLSVVILIILGIKYMMGSAEEKADYKKTMVPYIIGAVCIFLAPTIANMVFTFIRSE